MDTGQLLPLLFKLFVLEQQITQGEGASFPIKEISHVHTHGDTYELLLEGTFSAKKIVSPIP